MHKNAKKVEWKTRSEISCHYTWLLHAKKCPSQGRFLGSFLTTSKPSRRSITAAKRREKEKKERRKKIPKIEKPKDVGHFLMQKLSRNFDFCTCLSHNALKCNAGGKKVSEGFSFLLAFPATCHALSWGKPFFSQDLWILWTNHWCFCSHKGY